MTRVLLVNSPSHEPGKVLNKLGRWIPGEQLGLCYLASVLREAGHTVEIWDAFMLGWSAAEASRRILDRSDEWDLVGLSVSDGKVHGCAQTLAALDNLPERIHLTLGGHTATLCDSEFLTRFPRLDSAVRGEGEIPLAALCRALARGEDWGEVPGLSVRTNGNAVRANRMPPLSGDLDELPFPARDNLALCNETGFAVSVETSRGCKGVCTFCATRMMYHPSIGRSWRPRSVDNILEEVEILINRHGVRKIAFEDEDFLGFGSKEGFERARMLAEEILRRGLTFEFAMLTRVDNVDRDLLALLKRAGLRFVFIGAESGSQRALDFYVKETSIAQNLEALRILQELEIDHEILWIMYDPQTTIEDVEANVRFLDHVQSLNVNLLNKLRIYHGTPMHTKLARQGRLQGDFLEYSYEFADPKVEAFEREASRGLSAFYQVLNSADVLKWQLADADPLGQAISLIMHRLHLSAVEWLHRLLDNVKTARDLSAFEDEAVTSAAASAQLLARLVHAWPMGAPPRQMEGRI